MTQNLSRDERIWTLAASLGVMALAAYFRPVRAPLAVTAAGLLARATSGYCPVTALRETRVDELIWP
jgi:hypothetical protein